MPARKSSLLYRYSINLLLALLFVGALISLAGHFALHRIDDFKPAIENALAGYGITGARLESVQGSWQGIYPQLEINEASLSIPGRSEALSVTNLKLSVDVFASLLSWDLKLRSLDSQIEKMVLIRDEENRWWLNDIELTSDQGQRQVTGLHTLFHQLPKFVNIDIRLIQIRDRFQDEDFLIQNTTLLSARGSDQSKVALVSRLPESLGGEMRVLLDGNTEQLRAYLWMEQVDLTRVPRLFGQNLSMLEQGRAQVQGWIDLENMLPQAMMLDARVNPLLLKSANAEAQTMRFRLRQELRLLPDGWRLDSRVTNLVRGQRGFNDLSAQIKVTHENPYRSLWIDRIDVAAWREVTTNVPKPDWLEEWLQRLTPRGELRNLVAQWHSDQPKNATLGFGFKRLGVRRSDAAPGAQGLSGTFLLAAGVGKVKLESERISADFGPLFRLPLKLDQLNAETRFKWLPEQMLVQVDDMQLGNADIALQGRAWLEIPSQGRPFMSLRATYRDAHAGATSKYLPVGIMPENTVVWLDQSIKAGDIPRGDLLFHGRLKAIAKNEDEQSGSFHARFDAVDPRIQLRGQWPLIHSGKGTVSFHNTAMDINFKQAKIGELEAERVRVAIPNLMRSELEVEASARSSADLLLSTLVELPPLTGLAELKRATEKLQGSVDSEFSMRLPLYRGAIRQADINASGKLRDLTWELPAWNLSFSALNGDLGVVNQQITAPRLNARLFGDPVTLTLDTDPKQSLLNFTMQGNIDSAKLARVLPAVMQAGVQGKSDWLIRADVPKDGTIAERGVRLRAESALRGTVLDFPAPLTMAADQAKPLLLDLTRRERSIDLDFSLANQLFGAGRLSRKEQDVFVPQALTLQFGYRTTRSPPAAGVALAGYMERVDADGWLEYLRQQGEVPDQTTVLTHLAAMDLNVKQLQLAGWDIEDTRLQLARGDAALSGSIQSSIATGEISIPVEPGPEAPLRADLESLKLEKRRGKDFGEIKAADMPNLSIRSQNLQYDTLEFTDFRLDTRNSEQKFIIDHLDFERDQVRLRSSGHWQHNLDSGEQVSVFNVDIRGTNFGRSVSRLGLGESIRGGDVSFNGQIGWGGSLFDLNWDSLIGEVDLRLNDGYLRDVEPGAGRLVGLLSFDALLGRLTSNFGDFGDVLSKGMKFDRIKGRFVINGETLTTQNAYLDSDAVRIKLSGTTNLRQQSYDQLMTIVPKVSDTLPVIGTIAAGSSVGWGLLLLQKLFEKPIEKSVEIEYKVSGSWDNPELVRLTKPEDLYDPILESPTSR